MNKTFFYPKLAMTNIKKNSKTYLPFLLSCIGTIMMFYILCSICNSPAIQEMPGSASVATIMMFGVIVIGLFAVIFLYYTNSFLIKRRKKELSLYNILGMEKKHIAKMLFFETVFVAFASIIIGLLGGIIMSRVMFLVLFKLLNFQTSFDFFVSIPSIWITIALFLGIFLLNLLTNLIQIHHANPIELMQGSHNGEKEPKTKWLLTFIGILTLSAGYGIAILVESPVLALPLFLVAVILVIIGTYSLFTSGSIAILKLLKKNKNFYYQTKHFISVSGMIYRMKQNAAGLANICILSSAVLVVLSTTVSLYIGMEDVLRTHYPRDFQIEFTDNSANQQTKVKTILEEELALQNADIKNELSYRYYGSSAILDNNSFQTNSFSNYADVNEVQINAIPLTDYNEIEQKNIKLETGEALIYSNRSDIAFHDFTLNGEKFLVKATLTELISGTINSMSLADTYYIILNDADLDVIFQENTITYYHGFDWNGTDEDAISMTNILKHRFSDETSGIHLESAQSSKANFFGLYGGFLFLGIFLGILFLMATVMIIYYKQVSEGFEDKERFKIMQKVGMSNKEIKKSIHSQILMVFFLPLISAIIHIAFAFKLITRLLILFNLTNVLLFLICTGVTILLFALVYALVFSITARAYYKIVQ